MRVYKRGGIYQFEIRFNGKHIRRSTNTANQKIAGQIASAFHLALVKGEVGIVEKKAVPVFADAMAAFLAWSKAEHAAHPQTTRRSTISSVALLKTFARVRLDQITPEDVESYKTRRAAEKSPRTGRQLRPATVNRELACMREMFNYVLKGDVLLRNPVSRVKFLAEDNQQERVLTFTEQEKYLAVASPMLKDVAGLILETGMRPEEVYTLTAAAVNLDVGYLRVLKGKTKAAKRQIGLTPEAHRILTERLEETPAGYLFPFDGDPHRPVPRLNNAHDRAVLVSKLPKFKLYDLRHTWATRAAEAGIDLVTLAAMMGHSRIQMVMRYAHPTQNHQTDAMAKVAKHNAARGIQERLAEERKAGRPTLQIVRSA